MWISIRQSLLMTIILTVILCGIYPLAVTLISKVAFNEKANGSLIIKDGKVMGSKLIGQAFSSLKYFHGRPSAAGSGYDAVSSSGSNLGPTNKKFIDSVKERVNAFIKENPTVKKGAVPVDMITASGSGLDPQISPAAALAQIPRVAKERKINPALIKELVMKQIEGRELGILGENRINVLELNLRLDALYPISKQYAKK